MQVDDIRHLKVKNRCVGYAPLISKADDVPSHLIVCACWGPRRGNNVQVHMYTPTLAKKKTDGEQ